MVMEELIVKDACSLVLTSVLILYNPPNLQCPSCNLQFVQQRLGLFFCVFSFFFLFFFFVFETVGAPPGGFYPHCLPWAPPRGFHPRIFYSFPGFSFLFFGARNVGGMETRAYSTTNIDLSRVSMNSCLERGFL